MPRRLHLLMAALALVAARPAAARDRIPIPHLSERGAARQLIVDGRPFLIFGGELANSSASSRTYMAPVWPRLRAMGLNTVLAPVSWQLVEPAEGRMEFASVDALQQVSGIGPSKFAQLKDHVSA